MLFNSIEFLIFLPLVFIIHWFACKSGRSKNLFLIAASYLFYGWWNMKLLALIFLVTIAAYGAGIAIDSPKASPRLRKFLLVTSIIINIGTLVAFKYFDFFAESFTKVLQAAGLSPDIPTLNLILPVGISFYTFQAMSYTIDVYRRKISATHDPAAFFVFISFFPQLVAGPIERASNILPQFLRNRRRFTYKRGVEGMQLILWGLFKKMVVADNAAVIVNQIFADPQDVGTVNLWIGALLFTFQIYGDFSGYSDIAIGTSRLFGIDLMKNFSLPYFSRDIAEFWRKWHISLTTWFRDYLYIPLGGNRKGKARTIGNTAAVFLVSGLWHGANFTYVAWGAYHALLFIPLVIAGKSKRFTKPNFSKGLPPFRESALMGITFLLVLIGWVIFRAESVTHAALYIADMFSHYSPAPFVMGKQPLLWIALLVVIEWGTRFKTNPLARSSSGLWKYPAVRWAGCLALFFITMIFAGNPQEFIYFKF